MFNPLAAYVANLVIFPLGKRNIKAARARPRNFWVARGRPKDHMAASGRLKYLTAGLFYIKKH